MQIVISLLGGLGLFLYGMNLMGESLEKVAGSKMKKIIELLTKNIFRWYDPSISIKNMEVLFYEKVKETILLMQG